MNEPVVVRRPIGPPPFALRVAAVLSVPLLLYVLVATGQKALENYQLNQQADALRVEIINLRSQNIQLQQDIERARTDGAIETIAREQLGLIKPGDHPIVISSTSDAASVSTNPPPTTRAAPTSVDERQIWRQWWDYFFG